MKKSDLSEFEIQDQEFKLRIKRDLPGRVAAPAPVAAAPAPDSPNFVAVGSPVKADTVVCIIEAMKVMNEIQSELTGTIVECLVASGTSVEFGQPLFRVKVG
jgi:biotin carboxyl carrier protein